MHKDTWSKPDAGIPPAWVQAQLTRNAPVAQLDVPMAVTRVFTVRLANRLNRLPTQWLRLWCQVTRSAFRQTLLTPELHTLDVLDLRGDGKLRGLEHARSLRTLRVCNGLTAQDLIRVARCTGLRELGAQGAALSASAIAALADMPELQALDLETAALNNRVAWRLAQSRSLTRLDLGGTRITRVGLQHLLRLQGLQALDLWSTRLSVDDLRLVLNMPQLSDLSVGQTMNTTRLDADGITRLLLDCPSLKRVWVDGVDLQPEHLQALRARLDLQFHPPLR